MSAKIEIATAGAGSGKTYKLMQLIREAILKRECRPAGLIATTFTNQAAAELKERVRRDLCAAGMVTEAQELEEALLGTVHSICARLLGRFAFEAGISPRIQVLDEATAKLMLNQAIEDACGPTEVERLEALTTSLGQVDSQTYEVLWRTQVAKIGSLARENAIPASQLAGMAAQNAAEVLAYFEPPTAAPLDAQLTAALETALRNIEASGDPTPGTQTVAGVYRDALRGLAAGQLPWSTWCKLQKAKPTKASLPFIDPVLAVAKQVESHPTLQAEVREYIELVFGVAERALAAYQVRKEERGFLDYADLEARALALLSNQTVAAAIAADYDLLLVDECQDTNPLQLAIFLRLSELVKGKTVLVGDPKQAIYGFRGSDPELLEAALAYVRQQGVVLPPLAKSFRARPELTDLFNAHFVPAFGATHAMAPGTVELAANRGSNPALSPALERWVISTGAMTRGTKQDPAKPKAPKNADYANALAEGVTRLLAANYTVEDRETKANRPLRKGDLAILSRSNKAAGVIAEALLDRGIPVSRKTAGLLNTPEVLLALACVRRLLDPNDSLAAAELIALDGRLSPEAWLENRLTWLAANPSPRWGLVGSLTHPALIALEEVRGRVLSLSPAEALDAAMTAANLFGVVTTWGRTSARAAQRRSNLEALRGLALTYEEASSTAHEPATLGGFLLWLKALANSKEDNLAVDEKADAVKVMTWHGSKGLEWPVVLCADLEQEPKPRLWDQPLAVQSGPFQVSNPLANRLIRFWPYPFGGQIKDVALRMKVEASPVGIASLESAKREDLRLLYVGFTRARDVLVLPFSHGDEPSWLDLIGRKQLEPADVPALVQDDLLDGRMVRSRLLLVAPAPATPQQDPTLHWFPPPQPRTSKLVAGLTPSGIEPWPGATVGATMQLGCRLPLVGKFDEERLGTALHAILAAELLHGGTTPRPDLVEQVLIANGVQHAVTATDALDMVARLRDGLLKQFQPTRLMVEVPFLYLNADRQRISGIIDLLLETAAGWVIIDHKSFPGASAKWPDVALSYSGQLRCYREALRLDGRPVCSTWIHFCTGGGLVEVTGLA